MYFIVLDRVAKILKCGTIGFGFDPFMYWEFMKEEIIGRICLVRNL